MHFRFSKEFLVTFNLLKHTFIQAYKLLNQLYTCTCKYKINTHAQAHIYKELLNIFADHNFCTELFIPWAYT